MNKTYREQLIDIIKGYRRLENPVTGETVCPYKAYLQFVLDWAEDLMYAYENLSEENFKLVTIIKKVADEIGKF